MSLETAFEADYHREYGVHQFTTTDGTIVTSLSHPSWEEFEEELCDLSSVNGYVLSPELITLPSSLDLIHAAREKIERRVETVRELSQDHPEALILLGSATFDEAEIVRNSLVVIRNGAVEGFIDKKQATLFSEERRVFSREPRPQANLMATDHGAMLCSDIFGAASAAYFRKESSRSVNNGILADNVKTLIFSSCWAIKHAPEIFSQPLSDEEHFRYALEDRLAALFSGYPALEEVVTADRVVGTVKTKGPFNAHFKRTA